MPKVTQKFKLWTLLSSGQVVSPAEIAKTLGIKEKAVPVYVHKLKKKFKAQIEVTKDGKTVTGYRLANKIKVPEYRRNNAQVDKKAKAKKPAVVKNTANALDTDAPTVIGEREMQDVAASLGIDTGTGSTAE